MGLKMNKLTHLKALCERATKGPWINTHIFDGEEVITALQDSPTPPYVATAHGRRDAEFIAACNPETILKLLSIIEIQRKALEYIKSDHVFQGKAVAKNGYQCRNRAREALTAVDEMLGE
jgi:hypothetical protein